VRPQDVDGRDKPGHDEDVWLNEFDRSRRTPLVISFSGNIS